MTEACAHCSVTDALARHAPDCEYAITMGLPRLSDGEEPIEGDGIDEGDREAIQAPPRRSAISPDPPALWLAWITGPSGGLPDAAVFASELEALRYAVARRMLVIPLRLGVLISEQIAPDPDQPLFPAIGETND